jgi:hypothetical protein
MWASPAMIHMKDGSQRDCWTYIPETCLLPPCVAGVHMMPCQLDSQGSEEAFQVVSFVSLPMAAFISRSAFTKDGEERLKQP